MMPGTGVAIMLRARLSGACGRAVTLAGAGEDPGAVLTRSVKLAEKLKSPTTDIWVCRTGSCTWGPARAPSGAARCRGRQPGPAGAAGYRARAGALR